MAHDKGLSGQRRRREGAQEQRGLRHVVHGGEHAVHGAAQHDAANHLFLADAKLLGLFGNLLVHQRRTHETRTDHVRAHVVLRAFLGQHACQAKQRMLGGNVGGLQRRGLVRMHRAHIDHGAAALVLVHMLERGLGGEEGAIDVDRLHLLPVGEGVVLDRVDDLDAGVGDQDIDAAKRLGHRLGGAVDRVLVGHIHRHGDGAPAGGFDIGGGLLRSLEIQVGDGDRRALLGQQVSNGLADAAGGAGHDGGFSLELHGRFSCLDGWPGRMGRGRWKPMETDGCVAVQAR